MFTELLVNFKEPGRLKTCRDRADPVPLAIGNIEGYRGSLTGIVWLYNENRPTSISKKNYQTAIERKWIL